MTRETDRPAPGETVGLLERRPVESAPVLSDLTGKEGNKLVDRLTGEITMPEEYRTECGERADRWSLLVVPVLREMRTAKVAELTGFSRRAAEHAIRETNRRCRILLDDAPTYVRRRTGC